MTIMNETDHSGFRPRLSGAASSRDGEGDHSKSDVDPTMMEGMSKAMYALAIAAAMSIAAADFRVRNRVDFREGWALPLRRKAPPHPIWRAFATESSEARRKAMDSELHCDICRRALQGQNSSLHQDGDGANAVSGISPPPSTNTDGSVSNKALADGDSS